MYIDDIDIYDENDNYLDNEYFYSKWKEESSDYYDNLDNINNEYNKYK